MGSLRLRDFGLEYLALFVLFVLTAVVVDSSWWEGPLYARIQLNLFYNSHALSVLPIVMAAFFMWRIKKDWLPTAVFAALGTASIHEIILDVNDEIYFRVGSGISIGYAIELTIILLIGLYVSKRYHRRIWLVTLVIMSIWFAAVGYINTYSGFVIGSTIDPNIPFGASKYFWDPLTNFMEIASWIAPCLLWFLPRKLFAQESPQSYLRSDEIPSQRHRNP